MLPVLNRLKHKSTVYPMQVQIAYDISPVTAIFYTSAAYIATHMMMRNA